MTPRWTVQDWDRSVGRYLQWKATENVLICSFRQIFPNEKIAKNSWPNVFYIKKVFPKFRHCFNSFTNATLSRNTHDAHSARGLWRSFLPSPVEYSSAYVGVVTDPMELSFCMDVLSTLFQIFINEARYFSEIELVVNFAPFIYHMNGSASSTLPVSTIPTGKDFGSTNLPELSTQTEIAPTTICSAYKTDTIYAIEPVVNAFSLQQHGLCGKSLGNPTAVGRVTRAIKVSGSRKFFLRLK